MLKEKYLFKRNDNKFISFLTSDFEMSYVFQIIVTNRFIRNIIPIALRNAGIIRLFLMKERKYHKQKFNVREINLCEH